MRQLGNLPKINCWSNRAPSRSVQTLRSVTAYRKSYANKRAGRFLWINLYCQKQRKTRYGKTDRRDIISSRRFFDTRPAIVEERRRIGDCEADTSSAGTTGNPLCAWLNATLPMQSSAKLMVRLLAPHKNKVHTITSDNRRDSPTIKKLRQS